MEPVEVIEVKTPTVGCDGGGGPLGHPLVYLNLGEEGEIDCPYCGRRFVIKEGAEAAHGRRSGQRPPQAPGEG